MFTRVCFPMQAPRIFKGALSSVLGIIGLVLIVANSTTAQTPSLRVNDVTVDERDLGPNPSLAEFTISLSAPSQQTVSVLVSTQSDTATANVDFAGGALTVTFQPGQTSQNVDVAIIGDSIVEGTEQFFLNLSNPVNATIADGQGVCTIVDDDTLLLLTEPGVQRAAAVDSVTFVRDPFSMTNPYNFSTDQRTRITVLGIGLKLAAGETASAVTATAEDSVGTVRPLTVEYVAKVPNNDWLWQVILKLNDQITLTGDVKVRITVHGVTSNFVLVGIKP
jgi:hypothetical protein